MFQCTSRVIHEVPIMSYLLDYCGLLLFSLMGIAVCGCSWILRRYVCKMIGGNKLLVNRVYSYLLLIPAVTYPTFGSGSFHIHCIVLLWIRYWTYGLLSMHFCLVITWGKQLVIYIHGCNFHFSMLLMLCCPWNIILGWLNEFLSLLSIMWKHISSFAFVII